MEAEPAFVTCPNPPRLINLRESLRDLWQLLRHVRAECRRELALAIGLTAMAAIADVAALAMLQQAMRGFSAVPQAAQPRPDSVILGIFLAAAIIGSALRLAAQRTSVAAQYTLTSALAVKAFRNLQDQDYADYLRNGASEGFAAFERLQVIAINALAPLITGAAALLSVLVLAVAVAALYPWVGAMLALALFWLFAEANWHGHAMTSGGLSFLARQRSWLIYEARTAFRDIFLTNGQARLCKDFAEVETVYRRQQGRSVQAAQSSRHLVEIASFSAMLVAVLAFPGLVSESRVHVPMLGVLGLTALRLMPQYAALHSSLKLIALHGDVTGDVLALLDRAEARPVPVIGAPVVLETEIALDRITISREDRPETLRGLSIKIPRGRRIGIAGVSGSGKSTLLDVICGALQADGGEVTVDGQAITRENSPAWRERIGMVSQSPVLLGQTLREVVIFPQRLEALEPVRFARAVDGSGIGAFVDTFAGGLDTPVGEAVAFLSGGQLQRLALAHALYRARDLLILDEATGQLDAASEQAIIAAIQSLPRDLTIIVVSHRPALFACCDEVYALVEGRLVRDLSYSSVPATLVPASNDQAPSC
jgi:ABC-type multidrug transport system fused ATPase/permease subunit